MFRINKEGVTVPGPGLQDSASVQVLSETICRATYFGSLSVTTSLSNKIKRGHLVFETASLHIITYFPLNLLAGAVFVVSVFFAFAVGLLVLLTAFTKAFAGFFMMFSFKLVTKNSFLSYQFQILLKLNYCFMNKNPRGLFKSLIAGHCNSGNHPYLPPFGIGSA
jgi:hypothetical protein